MDDEVERLRRLVAEGRSVREIAEALGVHPVTAAKRLRGAGLRTVRASQLGAPPAGVLRECRHHGLTEHRTDERGHPRCRRCRAEAVVRRRDRIRETILREAGNACVICGYDRHPGALQFHHLDPATKSFTIRNGDTRSLERMRRESAKCVLLCANCHAEVEAGVTAVPLPCTDARASQVARRADPG